jgi:uncharacterized protein YhbP (UPF0306 family)
LLSVIAENLNVDATIFVEFDASSKGLGMLLKEQGHHTKVFAFNHAITSEMFVVSFVSYERPC